MQFKIWQKIFIGISIPSLITLAGGLLTYQYIKDVKVRHGFVEIADDLRERALEVRRNEKNFLLHKNDEYYKYCEHTIVLFNNSAKSISSEIIDQIGVEDFALLRNSVQTYSSLIYALLLSYHHEDQIVENVRDRGRQLESYAAAGIHAKELSTNFILNLRRYEKNYMLFRDTTSFDRLNDMLTQFGNITPFCAECNRYAESIRDLFSIYTKNNTMVGDLQVIGDKLEDITNRIARSERQKVRDFFTYTQRLLLAALILLCTIGPLFVYKTATYIVAPVNRLAAITRKISEGDMMLRAPLKEHDETYHLAVSFNKMLDHLQFTHVSLEKSMELLREKQKEVEKCASVGLLVSGVAHELNNPLNNISLTAETMKEDIEILPQSELVECMNDILTQCDRAKHVVENLLNYVGARKSSEKIKLNIVSVVKESVSLITNELIVSNIHLNKNITDRDLYVKGDYNKIEEILVNIMVNAIHSMKDSNPGILSISVDTDEADKYVFIRIGDTGQGIPEKDQKNIFEPFFTTKPTGVGTGLGLSVAQNLVREHEGEIEVESAVGAGSTFTITLPLYEEA